MSDAPVDSLSGIGPVARGWLEEAGIRTVGGLRASDPEVVPTFGTHPTPASGSRASFEAKNRVHFFARCTGAMDSLEVYRRLKFMLPRRVSLNALYGLEAALRGRHWVDLPPDVKSLLQQAARTIEEALRRGAPARCMRG